MMMPLFVLAETKISPTLHTRRVSPFGDKESTCDDATIMSLMVP
jgi:hypothetical protein